MNKSMGHRYRVRFSLFLWVMLIFLFIIIPSNSYFVHSPYTKVIALSAMLLTIAFSLFTYVLWLVDRRKPRS